MKVFINVLIDEDYCDNDYDNVSIVLTKHEDEEIIRKCKRIYNNVIMEFNYNYDEEYATYEGKELSNDEEIVQEEIIKAMKRERATQPMIDFLFEETIKNTTLLDTILGMQERGFVNFVCDFLYYCDELIEEEEETIIGY